MGTSSKPLFVTVSPGVPENYTITISELSDTDVDNWRYNGFLDSDKESYSLSEFLSTNYDSHKIMGYLTCDQVMKWLHLFEYLAKKYSTLHELQFHFYCSDEKEPFYFQWKRENIRSHKELQVYVGSNESIYWFSEDSTRSHKPYNTLIFQEDMYALNWKKARFRSFYVPIRNIF
jgi:hypothetical protein